MLGKRKRSQELTPPPAAAKPGAREILRAWAAPDGSTQFTLRITWEDPAAWGLLLVDLAEHAANAYQREGRDKEEVRLRIREGFDAEWSDPTDQPVDLADG